MADNSGSSAVLGVIVGVLIVLGVLFFFWGWPNGGGTSDVNVSIDAPSPSVPEPKSN